MKHRMNPIHPMLIALLTLIIVEGSLPSVHAQTPNQVGLVVTFGDGSTTTYCIEFGEQGVSGYDVLRHAELSIVASFDSGMGAGICKIEDEGCPKESCLTCDVPNYWSYWHLDGGFWIYSQVGASSYTVHNGDVEGWRWGTGDSPPIVPFDQICAPPATDTPVPTDTPLPPTNTPLPPTAASPPTDTPGPTDTPQPAEPEVWFRLDENPIAAGSCTMLRWDTSSVMEVYLDGEPVASNSSRQVCPSTSQEYTLRVVGSEDEQNHRLTLGVTGAAAPSETPTLQPTAAPSQPSPTPPPATATPSPTDAQLPQPPSSPSPPPTATSAPATLSKSTEAAASPSPTPLQVADLDAALSATPEEVQATSTISGKTEESMPNDAQAESEQKNKGAFSLPIGYVAFSLVVGGLLGWLVFIFKFQK